MNNLWPIFKTGYYGIKRGRAYQTLFIFAFLILAFSNVFTFFTREEEIKIIKDAGLMAINLFGIIFILFGLSRVLPGEIEERTIYTILTNPVNRSYILLANLGAHLYVLFTSFLIMAALFFALVYFKEDIFDVLMVKAVILIYLKIAIFSVLVLFLSVISPPIMNITISLFLYISGHLANYINSIAEGKNFVVWCFLKCLYTILPNFENYNFSDSLVLGQNVSWQYIGMAGIYTFLYGAAVFLLSSLIFRTREI